MVQEVLRLSEALHIQWPLEDDVTNLDLEAILYPERHKKDENRLIHDATSVADNVTDHSNLNKVLSDRGSQRITVHLGLDNARYQSAHTVCEYQITDRSDIVEMV